MPSNQSALECEARGLTIAGFHQLAFLHVDLEFQAVLRIIGDAAQHPLSCLPTFHPDNEVVSIANKLVAAPLQLSVQRIEHDVGQQW